MVNVRLSDHGSSAYYNRRRCRCDLCVEWSRTYHKRLRTERREKWFAENGPCVVCGSWDDLQLDHINRDDKNRGMLGKKASNQDIWKWPEARRIIELALCQILCLDCHKQKSSDEMKEWHVENKEFHRAATTKGRRKS